MSSCHVQQDGRIGDLSRRKRNCSSIRITLCCQSLVLEKWKRNSFYVNNPLLVKHLQDWRFSLIQTPFSDMCIFCQKQFSSLTRFHHFWTEIKLTIKLNSVCWLVLLQITLPMICNLTKEQCKLEDNSFGSDWSILRWANRKNGYKINLIQSFINSILVSYEWC